MTSYAESAPSISSKNSKFSVYQTGGKPLSGEAIYRAKLKYGIYNNPARVNLGVDPSASDTAALLASNTDLSISRYSRDLSSEAATAALIAKTDSAPTAWKRQSCAPEAEYAAISAKSLKFPFNNQKSNLNLELSEDAASSALKKSSKNVARDALQDLYDFDDIRSGKVTLSQFSNTPSYSKSLSSTKDYRSGIATSHNAHESSRKMNIGNIAKTASESATKALNSRLDPEKNFRSGIKTTSINLHPDPKSSGVYISNIHNNASETTKRTLSMKSTRTYGLPTPTDEGLIINPAAFAAGALKEKFTNDYAATERATLEKNTLVNNKVYAYASEKTNQYLSKLDNEVQSKNMFSNKNTNALAFKIAQENYEKRKAAAAKSGVLLGGGLVMPRADIDKIAQSLVSPVLNEMDDKITKMRVIADDRKNLPAKIRQRNIELKEEQRQAQIALEKKRAEEAAERRRKMADDKQDLRNEQEKIASDLRVEYDSREEEYNAQVEEETAQKKEVDDERAEKLKVLNDTKAEKDAERSEELETMQKERDDDVAPLLEELEKETLILNDLISVRDEKEAFFNEHKSRVDNSQKELDDTLSKLEIMNQRLAELEAGINETSEQYDTENSAAELAENQLEQEGTLKQSELEEFKKERVQLEDEAVKLDSERQENLDQVNSLAVENNKELAEINEVLPEHLRKEISDVKPIADDDLDPSKFVLDDTPIEEPAEVESEPEDIPEEVWPHQPEPEPVEEEAEEQEQAEEQVEAEPVTEVTTDQDKIKTAPAVSTPLVKKKTWSEIKQAGDIAEGDDPLINIPTNEKPAMISIVNTNDANEIVAPSVVKKEAVPADKTGTSKYTPPVSNVKNTQTAGKIPIIKSGNKKNMFNFFNKQDKVKKQDTYRPRQIETDVVLTTKKFKGLQPVTVHPFGTEEQKKEAKEVLAGKVTKDAVEPKKTDRETAAPAADDDVFSGFSQGSEVDEGEEAK